MMKLYKITLKNENSIILTNTENTKDTKTIKTNDKDNTIFNYDIYYNDLFLFNNDSVYKVCKNERHYNKNTINTVHNNNCTMTHKDLKEFEKLTKATLILKDKQLTQFINTLNNTLQEMYIEQNNTLNREVLDALKTLIINKKKGGMNNNE